MATEETTGEKAVTAAMRKAGTTSGPLGAGTSAPGLMEAASAGAGAEGTADAARARAWSPEQISATLKVDFPEDGTMRISHEAIFDVTWQRCRVHWMRNAHANVPRGQHTVVAAAIRQALSQPDREQGGATRRHVADQVRARWPKLAALMN